MKRFDIINNYISKYNYQSYLEVGVQWGTNFKEIKCPYKLSVDPDGTGAAHLVMTSDKFFECYTQKWDCIFIDGLHKEAQVDRDIQNSLNVLNPNGTIILHDCNPIAEKHQLETWDGSCAWNGSVWRSIVKLRATRPDLDIFTIDTDYGCGIIRKGNQTLISLPTIFTYQDLERNRKEWLNLKTPQEFLDNLS